MKKILIIDDEKTVSTAIGFGLKKMGYQIVEIQNPLEIITQLKQHRFNLLILDYNLTLLSGTDVIKLLKNNNIQIPIVIISSQNAEDIINSEPVIRLSYILSKDQPITKIVNKIENILHE